MKRIRFSEETKKSYEHNTMQESRKTSERRIQIVKKLLNNKEFREKKANNEQKISELTAIILSEYNMDSDISDFLILDNLLFIYRSSRTDSIIYFENLKQKYYMQAPISKKSKIIRVFKHFEPAIELILEIRNS